MENTQNQEEWQGKSFHRIAQISRITFRQGHLQHLKYHCGQCSLTNGSFEGYSVLHKNSSCSDTMEENLLLMCACIFCAGDEAWLWLIPLQVILLWLAQSPGHSLHPSGVPRLLHSNRLFPDWLQSCSGGTLSRARDFKGYPSSDWLCFGDKHTSVCR